MPQLNMGHNAVCKVFGDRLVLWGVTVPEINVENRNDIVVREYHETMNGRWIFKVKSTDEIILTDADKVT